jgi:PTS system nitrogen regulatory IIA component
MRGERKQVASWLQPEEIHLEVPLRDVLHALDFIASAVAAHHGLEAAPIFRALERREQAGSTGLGAGFALPHARIPGIEHPLTLLVRTARPIDFKAPDREPVSLILAILVPQHGDRNDHLELLALVAELFSKPDFRARMETGTEPAVLARSLHDAIAALRK